MPATPELTFERLLDWIEGRLSAEEASTVAALVAQADESVQIEVARQRAFQALNAQTRLEAPPPAVRSALMERFAEFAANKQSPSLFQRLMLVLTFDSALQPGMAGARATATDSPRQLVYTTALADIVLNIQWRDQDPHANLFGQVLPNQAGLTPDEFVVQLLHAGHEIGIVMADAAGEFAFEAVPSASYQLILSKSDTNIELPLLDLQRPAG